MKQLVLPRGLPFISHKSLSGISVPPRGTIGSVNHYRDKKWKRWQNVTSSVSLSGIGRESVYPQRPVIVQVALSECLFQFDKQLPVDVVSFTICETHICMHTCVYIYGYMCIFTYINIYMHIQYTCVCVYIHVYIYCIRYIYRKYIYTVYWSVIVKVFNIEKKKKRDIKSNIV